jgi:pyridoxine 4-dehydrogenase
MTTEYTTTFSVGGRDPVNRIGYGAMQLAGRNVLGPPGDIDGALAVLRAAVDRGVRFFDTANAYGPRTVNQLIGRALSPLPDDVVIGNKVGATRGAAGEWLIEYRPEAIRAQVEEAAADLGHDASPLTYLRLPGDVPAPGDTDGGGVPLEERLGVLVDLRDAGKIRHIGLSGATPEMLERAQRMTPIAAVQNRFNLIDRSGVEVLAACERHGIAFVPYFPLAAGGLEDSAALRQPADRIGVPVSTIALAWLLRRSPVIVPIPGTTSVQHLDENIKALTVAEDLTENDFAALTSIEDEQHATLSRMPDRMIEAFTRVIGG